MGVAERSFIQPRFRGVLASYTNHKTPKGHSLLAGDEGSDTFWVCETLSGIPLSTLFWAYSVYFYAC